MKLKSLIFCIIATTSSSVFGQVNSPAGNGYVARAAEMLSSGNYQGCLDQCKTAVKLGANNFEQLDWFSALAAFKGNFPEAKTNLMTFCKRHPNSSLVPSAKLMLAILQFRTEDYAGALTALKEIKASSINLDETYDLEYYKAVCLIKLGQNEDASKSLNYIKKTKRFAAPAKFYLGYIAYTDEDYKLALEYFNQCDKSVEPGNMSDFYVSQILFKNGKYADALNLAMPLLARKDISQSFLDETNRIVGECLYELGNISQSLEYLRPYAKEHLDIASLTTRYIVGSDDYQLGDYDSAISLLLPVSDQETEMGQSAAFTIGQSYLALGNSKAAILAFDKAARLDFNSQLTERAYYNYAVAQIDGGRVPFGGAISALEQFIQKYPKSQYVPRIREYLLKGYMATEDYQGALKSLELLKDSSSEDVLNACQLVNFVLGTRALQADDIDGAIKYLDKSLEYSSRNADIARQAKLWLGDAYYAKNDYETARQHYQTFLKTAPSGDMNRPIAQYNLAYCFFGLRNYKEARTHFRAAEGSRSLADDASVDCLNRIADTYYYLKDFKSAAEFYKKAYDKDTTVGDYSLFQYALMQGNMGKHVLQVSTLSDLIQKYPTSSLRSSALIEKAVTLTNLGKNEEAIKCYEQVVDEYPATSQGRSSLLQLAVVNVNSGNESNAIKYYKALVQNHPTSPESEMAVRDLTRIYAKNGNIEELNEFLEKIAGAPQLDAVERNAIAAATLLKKAETEQSEDERLNAALELLNKYPEADGAERALQIAADIEFNSGLTEQALQHYTQLEQRASTSRIRHLARMGILRSARDMGVNDKIISISNEILNSSAASNIDVYEVKFIRACAFADLGNESKAVEIWSELAKKPSEIFGTRSSYELGDYYYKNKKYAKATEIVEALIDANPPHAYWLARTFVLYSDILRAQGATFEADEYLKVLKANYPGTENDIFLMIDQRLSK